MYRHVCAIDAFNVHMWKVTTWRDNVINVGKIAFLIPQMQPNDEVKCGDFGCVLLFDMVSYMCEVKLFDIPFKNCNPQGLLLQKYMNSKGQNFSKMLTMVRNFKKIQASIVIWVEGKAIKSHSIGPNITHNAA